MAIKFKVHGIEVTADDAAEAYALLSQIAKAAESKPARPAQLAVTLPNTPWPSPATPTPAPQQRPPQAPDAEAQGARVQMTAQFLKAVKSGGADGLGTEGMLHVFNTQKPKALGSKTAMVNAVLDELSFRHADVYQGTRTKTGKVFTAGAQIDAAIAACAAGATG